MIHKKAGFFKHCEKRRKMLVNSIFSYSHNVFYAFKDDLIISATFHFSDAKAFHQNKFKMLFCVKKRIEKKICPLTNMF